MLFCGKQWKLIDLAKTRNFLHKLACFRVFINFLAKSCRKFWFCEKSWQHIDLVKTISVSNKLPCFKVFIRFSANKYKKVCDFAKTAKILIELAKTSNFSYKVPCFNVFIRFSAKSCKKLCDFVKNHENPLIWPKLSKIGRNYHLLNFYQVFSKTLVQSVWFCEESWKLSKELRESVLFC